MVSSLAVGSAVAVRWIGRRFRRLHPIDHSLWCDMKDMVYERKMGIIYEVFQRIYDAA
jgi:hypothetical protein